MAGFARWRLPFNRCIPEMRHPYSCHRQLFDICLRQRKIQVHLLSIFVLPDMNSTGILCYCKHLLIIIIVKKPSWIWVYWTKIIIGFTINI